MQTLAKLKANQSKDKDTDLNGDAEGAKIQAIFQQLSPQQPQLVEKPSIITSSNKSKKQQDKKKIDDFEDTPKIQATLSQYSPHDNYQLSSRTQNHHRPISIGVCGGHSSGKLLFSEMMRRALVKNDIDTIVVKQEKYEVRLPDQQLDIYNMFDWPKFIDEVDQLMQSTHDVIIVEGTMILYHEELRKNLLVKVYLDTDEDIRLSRKVYKDVCVKNKDVGESIQKYIKILKPLYERFVLPSKKYAEIVIPNYGDGFSTVYKEGQTAGFAIIDHPLRGLLVENIMQTIMMRKKFIEEKDGKLEMQLQQKTDDQLEL